MKYVVGLGNPGDKYLDTRHNIGFAAAQFTADKFYKKDPNAPVAFKSDKYLESHVYQADHAMFLKPQTFMNESGRVVSAVMSKREANITDFLIICDDVNLEFGKIRLRASGSSGGHHGLESVIASTGSDAFARLRIGVGRPDMPADLTNFVLGRFDADEIKLMGALLDKCADVCREWVEKDFESAMKKLSITLN